MIPCFVTCFNLLSPLPQLVSDIRRLGCRPVLVDNASTYPPLLEWLDHCGAEVIRLDQNYGPWVAWSKGLIAGFDRFVITDSDLDLSGVPDDVLDVLEEGFREYPSAWKVGLSLEIDDLPPGPIRDRVIEWEKRFWQDRVGRYFIAPVDTTFALYDPKRFRGDWYTPALRADRPYTARHLPWYWTQITAELSYYFRHIRPGITRWSGLVSGLFQRGDSAH